MFFYDLVTNKLRCIKVNKNSPTSYSSVILIKIKNKRVIMSFQNFALIINVKEKQIERKLHFSHSGCLFNIGGYLLKSSDDCIYQYNINKAKYFNKIQFLYNAFAFTFTSLVDLGNNSFCGVTENKRIFLFKYK